MRRAPLRRRHHQTIARVLDRLDSAFLLGARCFFGGGTCISFLCGEFRESRDIDFLVSDRAGFRALREAIRVDSLGRICRAPIELAREVRADRDGIRTFIAVDATVRIKFELILEARIDLTGHLDERLGVPVLSSACLAAEKLLANADRGMDSATFARDLIDLAFLTAHEGEAALDEGLVLATAAYGPAALRELSSSMRRLRARGRLSECTGALGITDVSTLRKGLALLRRYAR